jgi:dolichol-phosphate mannosyltransferase
MKKAIIILPTYNEKDNIQKIIKILEEEVFPKIKDWEMGILVADDNSPDGTSDIVRDLREKYKNIDISSGEKKGLGAAYVRGMTYAIDKMKADILFEMDADLQHDPHKVPEFLKKIDEGYDLVNGNRYSDGGSIPKDWPFIRKLFSIVANLFVRTVFMKFSIHDWTGGYKAVRKEVFLKEKEELKDFKGYIFQISFLQKTVRDGFRIAEVPFHFGERNSGDSKIAPIGYISQVVFFVLTTQAKEMIFGKFGKFLVVGGIGFVINFFVLKVLSDTYYWDHSLANLVGAAIAIFSNFNFNNIWTFKEQQVTSAGMYLWKLAQFYATSAFGVIFIQTGTIFLGDRVLGEGTLHVLFPIKFYYIYFVIGTGLLLIWNFFIYSKFIWRKKPQ